ncbi:DUF1361 domain-containing protein [Rhodococcus yananensis]|uniref:DUF1361 domain-containing protein n=1 Tax=Rhodococcus yananensis TaxID=2879464 RepID=UPI003EBCA36D
MIAVALLVIGVALLNVYASALVVLRAPLFSTRLYRPMMLNIGLSLAPAVVLAVTFGAMVVSAFLGSSLLLWSTLAVGALVWLLALPNSAYLITELNFSHRQEGERVPLWYDIVLTLSLALSGMFNTLLNVLLVQMLYVLVARPNEEDPLGGNDSWVIVAVVLVLVPFGMYLGRYLRFNSWDVTHPRAFAGKLVRHFRTRGTVSEALGFCLTHTVLLTILYVLVVIPAVVLL